MSLYTKKISLPLAFAETIDFGKGKGLVPTIVQEENGQVMMLAYSNKESLTKALEEKKGVYYSRSRQILWTKGETSGNTQELFKIKVDCDKDTLLFIVRQKNKACHTGKYSCFGDEVFSVNKLYKIIKDRNDNPKIGSYTNRLLDDEKEIMAKIKEESSEVTLYKDLDNLRWEIADLLYFVNVLMVKKGLDWKDIERELEGRHRLKK
ncbi:MAG: bifunctional phosphoribosyl-AMP cyclohydrolase/phosphoribosyl-ATP diphosphatase HisIE [Nanoarchaeota archaeon]|nr:bifunctional phosphoribosyl-AMP cyclohydrolase/phosphoribosyl-ATP diphosphatase HisIE [Nanoarchaeota archaeon]